MIPLYDSNPTRRRPIVTIILIAVNVLAFVYEFSLSNQQLGMFFQAYAIVPAQLVTNPASEALTLLTSMFLHGGWAHLLGNMLYLWIFGDNVEDRAGHLPFLFFYLLTGLLAGAAQVVIDPGSTVPIVGASGAIAGVLGGYLILYPQARVTTLVPIYVFIRFVQLPALVVLGFWFVIQFFNGIAQIGATQFQGGGVAFFAHIGGFVAGVLLIRLFSTREQRFPTERY